jgi:serine/threonine protein kinase
MAHATNNFSSSTLIGQGGYGKVYKGVFADGTLVAIKRAQEGSLQGSKEFFTEIELLSRLHHRNLVSLIGYCDDGDEQVHFSTVSFWWCVISRISCISEHHGFIPCPV